MIISTDNDVVLRELTEADIQKLAEYANNEKGELYDEIRFALLKEDK